jgi:betaine reductase
MAKEIERSGIPVAYVTTLTSLAEEMRANRIVAGVRIPHPLGNPTLTPDNEQSVRLAVTRRALEALVEPVDGPKVFAVGHPGVR